MIQCENLLVFCKLSFNFNIMYSRISNESYRDIPLANFPDDRCPNYVYSSVADLNAMETPTATQKELSWWRTIGILHSFHGQLYICDMNSTGGVAQDINIHVSVAYLRSPQYTVMLQSLVLPSPVQMFGSVRWLSRKQVFFIKIMQVLTIPKALHMKDALDQLTYTFEFFQGSKSEHSQ